MVNKIINPSDEIVFVLWCTINADNLHAIFKNDEGGCFFDLKTLLQIPVLLDIDLHYFEFCRFSQGEIIQYWVHYFGVHTERRRKYDEECFRPVCYRTIEAIAFRPYWLVRKFENCLTTATHGLLQQFILGNA